MKYIILLRGVNISGKNKISMTELKKEVEDIGYHDAFTYLNSGNLIVNSDKERTEVFNEIKNLLKDKFNLDIPMVIITLDELEIILSKKPDWWGTNNKEIYDNIIFMTEETDVKEVLDTIGEPTENIDKILPIDNAIFWSFDLKNYRKSSWWIKTASTSIKDKITIRTGNTMKKIVELCKKD